MTPEEGFLQAVSEQPEDDAPRLIYADWLDENGEAAFAEFIRVQCELARHQQEDDRWLELKIREEELWKQLEPRWRAQLVPRWGKDIFPPLRLSHFRRGLVEGGAVTVETDVFVREAPGWIFLLGIGNFTPGGAMCDDFFACPQLWRVRAMNCERCNVQDSAMQGFAQARHFHNLRQIDFFRNYIGPAGIAAFARCPSLTNLTDLDLTENRLGPEGAAALVSSPVCRGLVSLGLSNNHIGDAGAQAVASSPHLVNLRRLVLDNNGITRAGAEAVRSSPYLAHIQELQLYVEDEEDDIEADAGG
jgi:uncharacterized protein (TIGR02996 family)